MPSDASTLNPPAARRPAHAPTPLATFTRCHLGIVSQLQSSVQLPGLLSAAARARANARRTLELFANAVLPHHAEEESELFPAVLRNARGDEQETVRTLVERLTAEHRDIEARWRVLEPQVRDAAEGRPVRIEPLAMADLVRVYLRHARVEETEFLPVAEAILARAGEDAALGLALHQRKSAPLEHP
jgi:hypothetical protein